jgi:hypothetical protein
MATAIALSYNRGCTIAQCSRRSLLKRKVPTGCLLTDRGLRRLMARAADPPSATLRVRLAWSCFILADYDYGHASYSRELSRARAQRLVREASPGSQGCPVTVPRLARDYEEPLSSFSVECPWQESNPWGSVLRAICVATALSYNRVCTIAQWLRSSLEAIGPSRPVPLRCNHLKLISRGDVRDGVRR